MQGKQLLNNLNSLSRDDFVRVIGPAFEQSPWIAEVTWKKRPFASVEQLHEALCQTVQNADEEKQLELIRAHPDLVGRAAREGTLTRESTAEQASAGLNNLSPAEMELFRKQNAAYRERFGFPFIICARLNGKEAILEAFRIRLDHSRPQEIGAALDEIFKIASWRLQDLFSGQSMPAKLSTHVLDIANGCPAPGMQIELWKISGDERKLLKTLRTNADGRTDGPLLEGKEFVAGQYELIFFVGDYFAKTIPAGSKNRFLDRVPVRFGVADAALSYHVPLLCSPWAYSTYRGS